MPLKKWPKIEAKYGKPMQEILTDLYELLGDHKLVANQLGVTMKTLWQWRNETGCETVVRVKCAAPQSQGGAE